MKLLCLIESVSRLGGGLVEVLRPLAHKLADREIEVSLLGLHDRHTDDDLAKWLPLRPESFRPTGPRTLGYVPQLKERIAALAPDMIHTHGLWKYHSLVAADWGRRAHRPFLVSPHGMLDPWALGHFRLKKLVLGILYENRHLHGAACLQALCASEADSIRRYGLNNPICQIPNGVDLPAAGELPPPKWVEGAKGRKILLYLGRIHPKKGLANLLAAWRLLKEQGENRDEWVLAIVGWDQGGHGGELKKQVAQNGLGDSVLFPGPQFGADKSASYRRADAFILPSFSEGLPMVILEAWAHRLPVLMTLQCNLPEGFACGAALKIAGTPEAIAAGLLQLMTMTAGEREAMGKKGYRLVQERFTWDQVATEMAAVYRWLLGGGAPPQSVRLS